MGLRIGAVAELMPDILRILDVAVGIYNDGAENRVNRISSAQPLSNGLALKALGCSCGSGIFLNRGKCMPIDLAATAPWASSWSQMRATFRRISSGPAVLNLPNIKVGSRLIVSISGTAVRIEERLLWQLVAGADHERALR